MTALSLTSSLTAVAVNIGSSFAAQGGTPPYTYAVQDGGAGGTIDSTTGQYLAPAVVPPNATLQYDTIQVTDAAAATATAQILVGDTLLLVCDVIQTAMGLAPGRVFIWDQKIFMPACARRASRRLCRGLLALGRRPRSTSLSS